jgi:hypothetical protein
MSIFKTLYLEKNIYMVCFLRFFSAPFLIGEKHFAIIFPSLVFYPKEICDYIPFSPFLLPVSRAASIAPLTFPASALFPGAWQILFSYSPQLTIKSAILHVRLSGVFCINILALYPKSA